LVLTDYIDGRMAGDEKKAVERHLEGCAGCRALYLNVKSELEGKFGGYKREAPPAGTWGRIRESIVAEKERRESSAAGVREFLKNILRIPKPVMAAASLILVFLAAGVVVGTRLGHGTGNAKDIAALVEYSIGATAEMILDEETGFGTIIEESFL
jgi:predicted anti-sigma-YlaC factor YlaD